MVLTRCSGLTDCISHAQAVMETHLEQYLYQPQKLLEDLRDTDAQQFRTAMKCLLEDKRDRLVRHAWPQMRSSRGSWYLLGRS